MTQRIIPGFAGICLAAGLISSAATAATLDFQLLTWNDTDATAALPSAVGRKPSSTMPTPGDWLVFTEDDAVLAGANNPAGAVSHNCVDITGAGGPGFDLAPSLSGALPADERPLNAYLSVHTVFRSPADKGEPLWWFDTADYQARATCYELYGSSYFYASGYNRMGGVVSPMGIAKFVGLESSFGAFAAQPLQLGESLSASHYLLPAKKLVVGSIPIHRTMSGVVAVSRRAQWYKPDPERLWANAGFLDGHVEFVHVFAYEAQYGGVSTPPSEDHPYY